LAGRSEASVSRLARVARPDAASASGFTSSDSDRAVEAFRSFHAGEAIRPDGSPSRAASRRTERKALRVVARGRDRRVASLYWMPSRSVMKPW